jgi:hypothetical protein
VSKDVSITDLIAELRYRGTSENVLAMHDVAGFMARVADALEAVTVPTENERDVIVKLLLEYMPGVDGEADSRTFADAILARFRLLARLPVPADTDRARLDAIYALLSSLDLDGPITREGTAWGSILREAKELSAEAPLMQTVPVVIESVEHLAALPEGSAILDRFGDVLQYRGGLWCSYESTPFGSSWVWKKFSPLTVIHQPMPRTQQM